MQDTPVKQLMTAPVLTVDPDSPVDEVADAMLEQGISSIVAIDDDCQPVGILTSTDFVRIVARGTPKETTTVGDHMTTEVHTTAPDRPIPAVAGEMVDREVSHFPVVDENGEVVGIVSGADLTDYVAGMAVREPTE
jgi:CBS domain-containing protein